MSKFQLDSLIRENVKNITPYSSARDEFKDFNRDMVFLDANENPNENGVNRYPDPQQHTLKNAIAEQQSVAPGQLLLGNGSDEVLDLLFRAFCEPGVDNTITMPPTYGMYKVLACINNVENKEVLLTPEFELDTTGILTTVNSFTKIIFICSPNNPTGNSFEDIAIEKLLTNFSGLVVVDEAYIDFSKGESWATKLERFPNLIVTQTLSKAYGMAGIRLGICIASPAIISVLNKIKPPYNVNALTQDRALEGLQRKEKTNKEVETILRERSVLQNELSTIGFVHQVYPSNSNFLLAKVDDAGKRYNQLLKKGIVVRNRSTQPLCKNTLRFTVGTSKENAILLKTLKELD